jgi:hypothetical protein
MHSPFAENVIRYKPSSFQGLLYFTLEHNTNAMYVLFSSVVDFSSFLMTFGFYYFYDFPHELHLCAFCHPEYCTYLLYTLSI